MAEWTTKWRYEVQRTKYPGIYRLKGGGHLVTTRVTHPKTLKRTFRLRVLPAAGLEEARAIRESMSSGLRDRVRGRGRQRQRWSEYAALLFERKVAAGDIASAKGREKWSDILENHLVPAFGEFYCDELRYADAERWRADDLAPAVKKGGRKAGGMAPSTANTLISVFKVICAQMSAEHEMRDPGAELAYFDTSTRPTYTDETPNAIPPEKVARFLRWVKRHYPTRYAMVLLGLQTGLRPSSMRPLRRKGPEADVKWDEGIIIVRRSHSLKQEVMNTTKTKKHQRLPLPASVMAELKAHVARFKPGGKQDRSELLFPSVRGGFCSRSLLDVVFQRGGEAIGLAFPVTPRSMRRTFKDVARAAGVSDFVRKSVSGHTTGAMDEHYSTAQQKELVGGMAAIAAVLTTEQDHNGRRARKKAVRKAVKR